MRPASFMDCLELHKLTVFTINAAESQKFYIQQGVRKPQRATVCQYVSRTEVLNGYLRHLPMRRLISRVSFCRLSPSRDRITAALLTQRSRKLHEPSSQT